jgi:hypothetical protein
MGTMKVFHYTKCNRLNGIFKDGFIATEMKRTVSYGNRQTDYVWLTEKLSYPKTALPLLSMFVETQLTTHLQHNGVVVDLDKIGKVFGNFYRFGFDSADARLKKWFFSKEREVARNNSGWARMESVANKVGDDVRSFWIATEDLELKDFSLEVYENGQWNILLSNASITSLTDEQKSIISLHSQISADMCVKWNVPDTMELAA